MKRNRRLLAFALLAAGAVASCSTSAAPPAPALTSPGVTRAIAGAPATQRSEGGQVTVEATWAGPTAGTTIDVKLDTHSVNLDALDLTSAVLRNDRGETLAAQPWSAGKGGHHREGPLSFTGNSASFLAGARWVELVLTGVGDIPERMLRWDTTL